MKKPACSLNLLARALHGAFAVSVLAAGVSTLPAHAQTPSYTFNNVKIGGSGYVPGIIAHPGQQGLFYARTDVGGAYRYNSATKTWIPLNDWTLPSQFNNGGIDAIAIDPNNTNKLYMVAGMYYGGTKALFLQSNDKGNTFTQIQLPFASGGNEPGRQVGERLMVDPNQGNILFYGSGNSVANAANNGLWKSTDGGTTWARVTSFPALSSDGTGAGISFIAFQKTSGQSGQATPVIFAGVNTKTAQSTGATLYKSTNGGASWSPVWGPTDVQPQRGQIGPDGNLYITYSAYSTTVDNGVTHEHYGPDGLHNGQVWKYNIANNQWTWITPWNANGSNWGFSGLSVHPTIQGLLIVNTIDRYDSQGETTYRSTDGGATWSDATATATFDSSAAPWNTVYGALHTTGNWAASVIDPFDANHVFVTSGGGIMESSNVNAANPAWAYGQNGIEETVINVLLSPTQNQYGAPPLISGGPDVCGFTHYSLTTAPATEYSNPTCSQITGMDYAKANSTFVVRVEYDAYNSDKKYGAISWNGGYSWNPFNSNGTATLNTGDNKGGGNVAVNANASAILWAPQDAPPAVSTNAAYSWTSLSGVLPNNVKIVADGYNENTFYAYDRPNGQLYISQDKGATWSAPSNTGLIAWGDQITTPPGIGGDVWLVTYNGLYHSTTSGWNAWTKTPGVTQATALGFGKAAPGANYPAMYVVGTVNNVRGYYRSIDGGNNWVRINSDQQQWSGSNNVITGDPKTFGTVYIGTNGRGILYGTSTN